MDCLCSGGKAPSGAKLVQSQRCPFRGRRNAAVSETGQSKPSKKLLLLLVMRQNSFVLLERRLCSSSNEISVSAKMHYYHHPSTVQGTAPGKKGDEQMEIKNVLPSSRLPSRYLPFAGWVERSLHREEDTRSPVNSCGLRFVGLQTRPMVCPVSSLLTQG